jgi:hypothetical protein
MRTREEFLSAKDYIHQNPVEARLVVNADEYRWSSAWTGWSQKLTSAAEAEISSDGDGTAEAVP